MTEYPFTARDLEALKVWDTPTICNGLEIVAPAKEDELLAINEK